MGKPKDYNELDSPYNNLLERGDSIPSISEENVFSTPMPQAPREIDQQQIDNLNKRNIKGSSLSDINLETWIKSKSYRVKTLGFWLDGLSGYAEFNELFASKPVFGYLTLDTLDTNPVTPTGSIWYFDGGATEEFRGEVSDGVIHSFDTTVV